MARPSLERGNGRNALLARILLAALYPLRVYADRTLRR